MNPSTVEIVATVFFVLAVLHTFGSSLLHHVAGMFPEGSVGENLFQLLGEVEVVFGLWAGLLVLAISLLEGSGRAIQFAENIDFTEPLFVFAIMAVSATRPVIGFGEKLIVLISGMIPLQREVATYMTCLVIGPLLGSFITEPAAMTVTALILRERFFGEELSARFKYLTFAVLLVNVSIGGVLTPYAAPPVLMVAAKWNWGLGNMMGMFGWKAALATIVNAAGAAAVLRPELKTLGKRETITTIKDVPHWLTGIHLAILLLIVLTAHHPVIFLGFFLFFMGVAAITREYQEDLKLRESLLVAFFLGGLVVLGGLQKWWLDPLIRGLDTLPLFLGTAFLTAFTDNAALTYLGAQVEGVSEAFKYALVGGAVAGGGLTIIANAPNPAGFAMLEDRFGPDGISALKLVRAAAIPTLIAMICFWLLP